MKRDFNFFLPQLVAITLFLFACQTSFSQGAYDGSGNWLALDGVDDYAVITDNSWLDIGTVASESFTIECFFYIPNLDSSDVETLIYKSSSYDLYLIMSNSSQDRVVFRVYYGVLFSNYFPLTSDTNLSVGWHHVAAIYVNAPSTTADTMKIYLDGGLIGISSGFGLDPGIYNSTGSLYVGGIVGSSSFYGRIDEIKISDTVRYSDSSYSVPSSDFSVDSHTRALWHFSEPVGSTSFYDATTNNNTLTGIGADVALPVQLTSFIAAQNGSRVTLSWITETEINVYGYDIERRCTGTSPSDWTKIGFVRGSGTSISPQVYHFDDRKISQERYAYRIRQIDNGGSFKYYGNVEVEIVAPSVFVLEQNYPNPFNPSTTIRYALPATSFVRLTIFNSLGQEVRELVNTEQSVGYHEITWHPTVSSGFYVYRIEAIAVDNPQNRFSETRKALFIK